MALWNEPSSETESTEKEGVTMDKNIILYGPPGTGKTYLYCRLCLTIILKIGRWKK